MCQRRSRRGSGCWISRGKCDLPEQRAPHCHCSRACCEVSVGSIGDALRFLPWIGVKPSRSSRIWDIAVGGRLLTSLQHHHKTVTSLCLGSCGGVLVTGAIDRRVNVIRLLDFSLVSF